MKPFGTILIIIGVINFFLYFLLWTLEDYGCEKMSMWPIFMWISVIGIGIVFVGRQKTRTRY